MAVIQTGGSTSGVANVDANSNLNVVNPKVVTQAGFVGMAAIRDSGSVTGVVNAKAADITNNNRQRVSLDTPVFQDQFNYTAQNTAMWKATTTTMTITYATGVATLNAGSSVATSVNAVLQTYRSYPMYTAGEILFDARCYLTQVPQANNAVYFGIGTPGTTAAPTDGVYFSYDTTGALRGVANWNGTTATTASLTAPSANVMHEFQIYLDDALVEFWIDGILQGVILLPAGAGTPSLSSSGYAFFQTFNAGSAPATAQLVKIANVQVTLLGLNTNKPWSHIKAGEGLMGWQGQNGGTMGTTAQYANSASTAAAVPTNTTAALGSGLGGLFQETMSIAVGTDGIISSYQNPAGSITQTPRNLYITGIRWQSILSFSATGGPFTYLAGIAFGHTAVSLATAEAATTKAPRRMALGCWAFAATAPVNTVGANIVHTFSTPILVQPGEFFQTILKNINTVGSSGTQVHMIGVEGYWE